MTQAQADKELVDLTARVTDRVNGTFVGGRGDHGQGPVGSGPNGRGPGGAPAASPLAGTGTSG
jgi:hypothetical protein